MFFDAVSLFNSIAKWVDANQSDVRWILTVAEAFATAGSQGMLGPIYSEADFWIIRSTLIRGISGII